MLKSLNDTSSGFGSEGLEEFEQHAEGLKKLAQEAREAEERMQSFLATFTDDIIGSSGFQTTFDILNKNIEGFGKNFDVTFNAIAESAQETFNFIDQFSQASFEKRKIELEQSKEIALLFTGESAEARAKIEEQYNEKLAALENKRNNQKKNQALFNVAVDTAQGIVSALAKGNIPLSIAIGVIGAAQAALIASTEVPQFKDGHFEGTHQGMALVKDGGRDEVLVREGRARVIKGRNVFLDMKKGDQILPSTSYLQKAAGSDLMSHSAYAPAIQRQASAAQANQNISVAYNGLTEKQLENALNKTIAKQPNWSLVLDKDGQNLYQQKQAGRIAYLNRRTSTK